MSFQENMEAGMRELRLELSGVGRTQGEIAEDLFRRNLKWFDKFGDID